MKPLIQRELDELSRRISTLESSTALVRLSSSFAVRINDLQDQINDLEGLHLGKQFLTGSGTYEPTPGTNRIYIRMVGAGGGGGGASGGAGGAAGGGGASGFYLERSVNLAELTGGVYSCGIAGPGGVGSGNGTAGGSTTISVAGQIITAVGGNGGFGMVSSTTNFVQPGSINTGSSPADISHAGLGHHGYVTNGVLAPYWSGFGGSNPLGSGGGASYFGSADGFSASGFGAGGGGAVATTVSKTGGSGGAGVIIIEEYS